MIYFRNRIQAMVLRSTWPLLESLPVVTNPGVRTIALLLEQNCQQLGRHGQHSGIYLKRNTPAILLPVGHEEENWIPWSIGRIIWEWYRITLYTQINLSRYLMNPAPDELQMK
jgi:hypothetical protein